METIHASQAVTEEREGKMAHQEEIFNSVFHGDVETLRQRLQEQRDAEKPQQNYLLITDEVGRSPLLVASLLGRSAVVSELVRYGAPVNQHTDRGYTSLHLASCWGHLDTVQTLLKSGADTKAQNFRGERPVDLANKYSRKDCENCLVLGGAEQDFMSFLTHVKGAISESETSLTKEERNLSSRVLAAKTEWLQNVKNPQVSDFTNQKKELEDSLQHILNKLAHLST